MPGLWDYIQHRKVAWVKECLVMDAETVVVGVLMIGLLAMGVWASRSVDRTLKAQAQAEREKASEAAPGGRKRASTKK